MSFLLLAAAMPKRYTPAQLAAAAAAGKPRLKASFRNDEAWHIYQDTWFTTFTSGEVLPRCKESSRASRWKAAVRQHEKVEAQRATEEASAPADILSKRLKVSDKWIVEHAPSVQQVAAASPQVSPAGAHATKRVSATVFTPGGVGVGATRHHVDVHYSLPPRDGESAQAAAPPPSHVTSPPHVTSHPPYSFNLCLCGAVLCAV